MTGRDFAEDDVVAGETGGFDDASDTTQVRPRTRQVMRATDDDDAAVGEPGADRRTRADVGGNQDRERTRPVDPHPRDDR